MVTKTADKMRILMRERRGFHPLYYYFYVYIIDKIIISPIAFVVIKNIIFNSNIKTTKQIQFVSVLLFVNVELRYSLVLKFR